MTTSAMRVLAIVAVAAISFSCADSFISGVPRGGYAAVNLAPSFAQGAEGGPHIDIARMRGVLRRGADSLMAEGTILGDSAILEFFRVPVTGDSTKYLLGIQAFDSANVLVFEALQDLLVLPGNNPPVSAVLQYSAPDASVATIDIPDASVALQWTGAKPGDMSCLNRAPSTTAVTEKQLTVTGKTATGQDVSGVRVGWTSRDTTVATVDENGVVRSRCSNRGTWVVASTFLGKTDSVQVVVTAPPFALRMSPESTTVARGTTVQLTALVVDENGNTSPASPVNWSSSDAARATVSTAGVVSGVANGRVLITARSGDRSTVAVVLVVRPVAAKVVVLPGADTALVGQLRTFFARAFDAQNRVIGDATEFDWFSADPTTAAVSAGNVKALKLGLTSISAKIDGKVGTASFVVTDTRPSGAIQGLIKDGMSDLGISGASVQGRDTVLTDVNGVFLLPRLYDGDNVTVSASGYVPVTVYNVPVYTNDTLRIPPAPLAPQSSLTGTMTGRVVNALNGLGVVGATVRAYAGVNAAPSPRRPDAVAVYQTTTASDGSYSITGAAAGAYTFLATGTGYSQSTSVGIAMGGTSKHNGDIILPPAATGGSMYAVLSWGNCGDAGVPCDLDAHLTGPQVSTDTTLRFHTYHAVKAYVAGDTIAALDVNDLTGPGPEVMSIRPSAQPGVYRFYVHDNTNAGNASSVALSQTSSARVDVYMNNRVVATFFPPAGQAGTLWKVFEWDGARLTQGGQISHPADVTNIP